MTTRTNPRREREHNELRQRILTIARQIARDEGWRNVTLRKIAEKIEYSHPMLYTFFKDKDELLLILLREGFQLLQSSMTEELDKADTPTAGLYGTGKAYLAFAHTYPELYQVMYGLDGVPFGVSNTAEEGMAIGEVAGRAISALDPDHLLSEQVIKNRVYLIWSNLHGLVSLVIAGRIEVAYAEQLQTHIIQDTIDLLNIDIKKAKGEIDGEQSK